MTASLGYMTQVPPDSITQLVQSFLLVSVERWGDFVEMGRTFLC